MNSYRNLMPTTTRLPRFAQGLREVKERLGRVRTARRGTPEGKIVDVRDKAFQLTQIALGRIRLEPPLLAAGASSFALRSEIRVVVDLLRRITGAFVTYCVAPEVRSPLAVAGIAAHRAIANEMWHDPSPATALLQLPGVTAAMLPQLAAIGIESIEAMQSRLATGAGIEAAVRRNHPFGSKLKAAAMAFLPHLVIEAGGVRQEVGSGSAGTAVVCINVTAKAANETSDSAALSGAGQKTIHDFMPSVAAPTAGSKRKTTTKNSRSAPKDAAVGSTTGGGDTVVATTARRFDRIDASTGIGGGGNTYVLAVTTPDAVGGLVAYHVGISEPRSFTVRVARPQLGPFIQVHLMHAELAGRDTRALLKLEFGFAAVPRGVTVVDSALLRGFMRSIGATHGTTTAAQIQEQGTPQVTHTVQAASHESAASLSKADSVAKTSDEDVHRRDTTASPHNYTKRKYVTNKTGKVMEKKIPCSDASLIPNLLSSRDTHTGNATDVMPEHNCAVTERRTPPVSSHDQLRDISVASHTSVPVSACKDENIPAMSGVNATSKSTIMPFQEEIELQRLPTMTPTVASSSVTMDASLAELFGGSDEYAAFLSEVNAPSTTQKDDRHDRTGKISCCDNDIGGSFATTLVTFAEIPQHATATKRARDVTDDTGLQVDVNSHVMVHASKRMAPNLDVTPANTCTSHGDADGANEGTITSGIITVPAARTPPAHPAADKIVNSPLATPQTQSRQATTAIAKPVMSSVHQNSGGGAPQFASVIINASQSSAAGIGLPAFSFAEPQQQSKTPISVSTIPSQYAKNGALVALPSGFDHVPMDDVCPTVQPLSIIDRLTTGSARSRSAAATSRRGADRTSSHPSASSTQCGRGDTQTARGDHEVAPRKAMNNMSLSLTDEMVLALQGWDDAKEATQDLWLTESGSQSTRLIPSGGTRAAVANDVLTSEGDRTTSQINANCRTAGASTSAPVAHASQVVARHQQARIVAHSMSMTRADSAPRSNHRQQELHHVPPIIRANRGNIESSLDFTALDVPDLPMPKLPCAVGSAALTAHDALDNAISDADLFAVELPQVPHTAPDMVPLSHHDCNLFGQTKGALSFAVGRETELKRCFTTVNAVSEVDTSTPKILRHWPAPCTNGTAADNSGDTVMNTIPRVLMSAIRPLTASSVTRFNHSGEKQRILSVGRMVTRGDDGAAPWLDEPRSNWFDARRRNSITSVASLNSAPLVAALLASKSSRPQTAVSTTPTPMGAARRSLTPASGSTSTTRDISIAAKHAVAGGITRLRAGSGSGLAAVVEQRNAEAAAEATASAAGAKSMKYSANAPAIVIVRETPPHPDLVSALSCRQSSTISNTSRFINNLLHPRAGLTPPRVNASHEGTIDESNGFGLRVVVGGERVPVASTTGAAFLPQVQTEQKTAPNYRTLDRSGNFVASIAAREELSEDPRGGFYTFAQSTHDMTKQHLCNTHNTSGGLCRQPQIRHLEYAMEAPQQVGTDMRNHILRADANASVYNRVEIGQPPALLANDNDSFVPMVEAEFSPEPPRPTGRPQWKKSLTEPTGGSLPCGSIDEVLFSNG